MRYLKENERKLVRLVNYFRKTAERLIQRGKLSPEHGQMGDACERLVAKINAHATAREAIIQRRTSIGSVIKDNASCPKCSKNSHLKFTAIDKSKNGWKMNKYKCRKCNIEFVWNRPNNPWDMLQFMEELIVDLEGKVKDEQSEASIKEESQLLMEQVKESYAKLKPIVESSDKEYEDLENQQIEMDRMMKEFKSYLLIEKVKMDAMEE